MLALKRVVSLQLQQILEQEHVTKTELDSRMKTSRASLVRMLDSSNPIVGFVAAKALDESEFEGIEPELRRAGRKSSR